MYEFISKYAKSFILIIFFLHIDEDGKSPFKYLGKHAFPLPLLKLIS